MKFFEEYFTIIQTFPQCCNERMTNISILRQHIMENGIEKRENWNTKFKIKTPKYSNIELSIIDLL